MTSQAESSAEVFADVKVKDMLLPVRRLEGHNVVRLATVRRQGLADKAVAGIPRSNVVVLGLNTANFISCVDDDGGIERRTVATAERDTTARCRR